VKTTEVTERFAASVRAAFPKQPEALPEGERLFKTQEFDRKLSIVVTARGVLRTCAAWLHEPERMKTLFMPDTLHFQHLYCIDWLLTMLARIWPEMMKEKPELAKSARPEQQILLLQIAICQAELSQDFTFKFSRNDPDRP